MLILPCSADKRSGTLPAIQKYVGKGYWHLYNQHPVSGLPNAQLRVGIVSAEYGLLTSDQLVPDYDRKLTRSRIKAFQRGSQRQHFETALASELDSGSELFLALPALYRTFFYHLIGSTLAGQRIHTFPTGGIGIQRQALNRWLDFLIQPPVLDF